MSEEKGEREIHDSAWQPPDLTEASKAALFVAKGQPPTLSSASEPPPPPAASGLQQAEAGKVGGEASEAGNANSQVVAESLATLKRQRIRTRQVLQRRALKLVQEVQRAEEEAESLKLVPFAGASQVFELPTSVRETLAILFGQFIALHLTERTTVSDEASTNLSKWASQLFDTFLDLLQLEKSPALSSLSDLLINWSKKTADKLFEDLKGKKHKKKQLEELPSLEIINPQPTKFLMLTQCQKYLQNKICDDFNKVERKKPSIIKSLRSFSPTKTPRQHHQFLEHPLQSTHEHNSRPPSSDNSFFSAHDCLMPSTESQHECLLSMTQQERHPPLAHAVVWRDVFLLIVLSNNFDARVFTIFRDLLTSLDISWRAILITMHHFLVNDLVGAIVSNGTHESQKAKLLRGLKIAGFAAGIGALTALTAGLAAPAIAAGVGALGIAGTSSAVAFLGTIGGSATVASIFGAGTAGLTGWKYSHRVGKIRVFRFERLTLRSINIKNKTTREGSEAVTPESATTLSNMGPGVSALGSGASHASLLSEFGLKADDEILPNIQGDASHESASPQRETFSDEDQDVELAPDPSEREFPLTFNPGLWTKQPTDEEDNVETEEDPFLSSKDTKLTDADFLTSFDGAGVVDPWVSAPGPSVSSNASPREAKKSRKSGESPKSGQLKSATSLTVTVCISGWLRSINDIRKPWQTLVTQSSTDLYVLHWDPHILLELGDYLLTILSQKFAVSAAQLWLQYTVAGALSAALMWPVALIQYAATLDNTWLACKERAYQAGRLLAEALCDKKKVGTRPVTLIGFSMGARVVHCCLQELHRREMFHVVTDAILLGVPTSCDKGAWKRAREVVSGRLVNVYSRSDWLLAFLYRYMEWGMTVAGLSPIRVQGVESVDATGIVRSHGQWADKIPEIMAYIGHHAVAPVKKNACVVLLPPSGKRHEVIEMQAK